MILVVNTNTGKLVNGYNESYNERLHGGKIADFKALCLLQTYFMEKGILTPHSDKVAAVKAKIDRVNWTLDNLAVKVDDDGNYPLLP